MRLFVAARLPDAVERSVAELQSQLRQRLHGWRWVRPEGTHLTLRFLGEVDRERDERARDCWRRAAAGCPAFRVRLTEVGRFPPRGAPRVLWVGIREIEPGDALAGLATRLERIARELGWKAEERPFRPHLTLARGRRGARPEAPPGAERIVRAEGWVRQIVLFESDLGPSGARYTARARFPLGDEGGPRSPMDAEDA